MNWTELVRLGLFVQGGLGGAGRVVQGGLGCPGLVVQGGLFRGGDCVQLVVQGGPCVFVFCGGYCNIRMDTPGIVHRTCTCYSVTKSMLSGGFTRGLPRGTHVII